MEMEDQYGLGDLRQLMSGVGRSHFPVIQTPTELFPTSHHHQLRPQLLTPAQHPYELMMMGRLQTTTHDIMPRGLHPEFRSADSAGGACANNNTVAATSSFSGGGGGGGGLEAEGGGCLGGVDGGNGRWPRQETLTLLEIRSQLNFKFKEANQKGPLWDEVSRIMCDEHGYQRSGKKCREKFENLYKYYKKTKEGKAGRQDGKHYRFFRQLEALYGETSNNVAVSSVPPDQTHFLGNNNNINSTSNNNMCYQARLSRQDATTATTYQSTQSPSNSEFGNSSSSEDNDVSAAASADDNALETKRRRKRRGWKGKIKEFLDAHMKKMMEKQEEWLDKLMGTLEKKESERAMREEQWRKQEAARVEREQQFWAKERSWIESRDKALIDALHKLTGSRTSQEVKASSSTVPENDHEDIVSEQETWPECEINRLVQLRGSMESKFSTNQRGGCVEEILWEEIAAKMSCLGYERSAMVCREKWERMNYDRKCCKDLFTKKRKENNSTRSSSCYFGNNESNSSLYSGQGGVYATCDMNNHEQGNGGSPPNNISHVGNAGVVNEICFPFLMGEGDNLWESYGLKLSKGSQNQ